MKHNKILYYLNKIVLYYIYVSEKNLRPFKINFAFQKKKNFKS